MESDKKTDSPGLYLSMIARYLHYYINREMASLNLNKTQVDILGVLYFYPGISQNELGGKLLLDKITVTKNLKGLLDAGYVEKVRGEKDRRVKRLYITEKGYAIGGEVKKVLLEANAVLLKDLTPEEEDLTRKFLRQIAGNIYREVQEMNPEDAKM